MEHFCNTHNTKYFRNEKTRPDGSLSVWYSHKLEDGSYCNEKIAKPFNANPKSPQSFENSLLSRNPDRIERQHSQEMALRFLDLLVTTGQLTQVTSELVKQYTDWFQTDVGNQK